jgi:predicted transcriptional regulator of viral defense system
VRPDHWIQLTVLAAAQHGLVTAAQIAATGTSRRTVTRAVASGLLRRVRPSVYVVAGTPPSVWQPLMAAYLAAGTGAVASHRSAGGLLGLPGILPGAVELTFTGPARRLAGARCHTTELLDHTDVARVGGFQATSAVRTIIDLAGSVHPTLLSTMVAEASRRRLCSDAALGRRLAALGGSGRAGTVALTGRPCRPRGRRQRAGGPVAR